MNNKCNHDNRLKSPILFLVFNRPETTKLVFEKIQLAKPTKLYIAADGAREDRDGEFDRVAMVRQIATQIDWDCETKILFREKNLGCKTAVSEGITWFFQNEDEGIILEDDCVPDPSFFSYCDELLEKYRHDKRIVVISGNNFQAGKSRTEDSYYFSRYTHIWGWATWKRAWQDWDGNLSSWPEMKKNGWLNKISEGDLAFEAYWSGIFNKCFNGGIDTWDYPWLYSCWAKEGLTILPRVNLVSNIGFGEGATHTNEIKTNSSLRAEKIETPLRHPISVVRNRAADLYTDKYHYHICDRTVSWKTNLKLFCNPFLRIFGENSGGKGE